MTSPPPDPDASANEYFLEIESHFARVRETTFLFSSKDWALMKGWYESGVPLAIVLEAIDSCFMKRREGARKRTISSLSYCRHAVEELWSERKDLFVGKADALPESQPEEPLALLVDELRHSAAAAPSEIGELLNRATEEVREARSRGGVPQIEEELLAIEERLLPAILDALSPAEKSAIEDDLEAQLAGMRPGDPARNRTRAANLKRLLRGRYGIPRLSLFR